MAILENGLLKLAATKVWGMTFPLGMVAVAAIWVWGVRERRSAASHPDESSATGSLRDTGGSARKAAGPAHPSPREHTAYRPAPGSSIPGGTDREALLSQILEENIRLREALK